MGLEKSTRKGNDNMAEDRIHKLGKLVEKRKMIEDKAQQIKRIVEKDDNPLLQFCSAYLQPVSIARKQAPDLFDEICELVLNHLQAELDELNATLDKANNILKECITDEI